MARRAAYMGIMEDHPGRFFSNHSLLVKFALLVVCAIVPFAVVWSIRGENMIPFTIQSNYWFAAAIFAAALVYVIRELVKAGQVRIVSWAGCNRWGVVLAFVLAVVLQVNEPHRAKVLYDEDLICGVAYLMHTEHLAAAPVKMHMVNNTPVVMNRSVDKRPVGYPFVLSMVHDLSGYRYSNVFVLNAMLGFVLLVLLFAWSKPLIGSWGAACAMVLLCTLPLLAQNATAAGFEVFNLCLIVALALAARRYLSKPGSEGMNLMICAALALSIARYESILYLVVVVTVVVVKWVREKRITLTWFAVVSPLFLMSALTSFHVFMSNDGYFQLDHGKFLSLEHLHGNAMSAFRYLTAMPVAGQSNSLILAGAGFASVLILLGCLGMRKQLALTGSDSLIVLYSMLVVVAVNTTIGLMENMGAWELPYTARFSLPMYLFMVLCLAAVFPLVSSRRGVVVGCLALVTGWFLLVTVHQNAKHFMTNSLITSLESESMQDWVDANAKERDLIVDDTATGMILHGHPGIMLDEVNRAPWKLKALLDEKLYDHVYICEAYMLSSDLKTWNQNVCADKLNESALKMRVLMEERIRYNVMVRVSELVDVVDPDAVAHRRPEDPKALANWLGDIYP